MRPLVLMEFTWNGTRRFSRFDGRESTHIIDETPEVVLTPAEVEEFRVEPQALLDKYNS